MFAWQREYLQTLRGWSPANPVAAIPDLLELDVDALTPAALPETPDD